MKTLYTGLTGIIVILPLVVLLSCNSNSGSGKALPEYDFLPGPDMMRTDAGLSEELIGTIRDDRIFDLQSLDYTRVSEIIESAKLIFGIEKSDCLSCLVTVIEALREVEKERRHSTERVIFLLSNYGPREAVLQKEYLSFPVRAFLWPFSFKEKGDNDSPRMWIVEDGIRLNRRILDFYNPSSVKEIIKEALESDNT